MKDCHCVLCNEHVISRIKYEARDTSKIHCTSYSATTTVLAFTTKSVGIAASRKRARLLHFNDSCWTQ